MAEHIATRPHGHAIKGEGEGEEEEEEETAAITT